MEEFDIKTSYGAVHMYKKGTGERNVFLLHGAGCDSAMLSWREVMERFDDRYTVYAMDFLGYGKSEKPEGMCGEKFYPTHIAAVNEAVSFLKLDSFVLAGLSMGGAVAIGYALKYPEKVEVLIPVDSWGLSKKLPFHRLSCFFIHKTDFTLIQYRQLAKSRRLARWCIAYSLIGDKSRITDEITNEVLEACKGDMAGKSMQDYQRSSCGRTGAIPYYGDRLKKLGMPVIFVNGERDSMVPVKDSEAASRLVPSGKLFILKGCKHWSVKERPEEFLEIIEKNVYRKEAMI